MESKVILPTVIAENLATVVVGQDAAVRELSIVMSKRLGGLSAGNVLMVGSSGTGKTTLMRAVERYLANDPELAERSLLIRVHANVLAEQTAQGRAGEALLRRLFEEARDQLGSDASC